MNTQERIAELERLKALFQSTDLPKDPIVLGGFMTIHNATTFINTNLVRGQLGIKSGSGECCILRLQQLESHLQNLLVQQENR